jgi:hypothetical protein
MKQLIFLLMLIYLQPSILPGQDNVKKTTTPFVLGAIEEIESVELSEKRILNIYFPEGYRATDTVHYPVIYLLDGSADEDFIHIAGLVQFSNFSWVNILPKSIVVGIANIDRRRDFTFPTTIEQDKKDFPTTGGSEKFIAFIEKEVQPFIERNYKTNQSKTIIGQSLGGLLATEILLKKPALFNNYIIISPSLWWDNQSLLAALSVSKSNIPQNTLVYVGVGKEGKIMEADARQLCDILNNKKIINLKVAYEYFEKEDHATIFHLAVYNAFKAMSSKKEK